MTKLERLEKAVVDADAAWSAADITTSSAFLLLMADYVQARAALRDYLKEQDNE